MHDWSVHIGNMSLVCPKNYSRHPHDLIKVVIENTRQELTQL